MFSRRSLFGFFGALGGMPAFASVPAWAVPVSSHYFLDAPRHTIWTKEAHEHPLAHIASEGIDYILKRGECPYQVEEVNLPAVVELRRPVFIVSLGPLWDTYTGWKQSELGPCVEVIESGVVLGTMSTFHYGGPLSVQDFPRYGLRRLFSDLTELDKKLPGQVNLDMSWALAPRKV